MSFSTRAQVRHIEEEIKVAYIYQFSNNIKWEEEGTMTSFKIGYLGNNSKILKYLNDLSKLKKWNGKKIEIISLKQSQDFGAINLLYIDKSHTNSVKNIYKKIEGKPVLMVTDQSNQKEFVMINFLINRENKIKFEVNRPNIFIQGLNIKPELLLLGGSEIDVVTIYRQARLELEEMRMKLNSERKKALESSIKIKDLTKELRGYEAAIELQKNEIEKLNNAIVSQKIKLKNQENKFLAVEQDILRMQKTLLRKSKKMDDLSESLKEKESQLIFRKKEIESFDEKIKAQKELISKQEYRIENQSSEINKKGSTIETQKTILFISLGIILLILSLVFLVFRGYSQKRKSNFKLTKQNIKIERQKEVLTLQADKLNKQKEVLQSTLDELQQAQSKLIQSEKMASLGVLTAGIAHEINNPINFVLAGSQSLQENYKDLSIILGKYESLERGEDLDEVKKELIDLKESLDLDFLKISITELIEDIHLGAVRTTEIVKGLRNFSRLDEEKMQESDIHEGIDATLVLLKNKIKNRIQIVKDYDYTISKFLCFPGQLSQVFMNMVSNAIDAIGEEGVIKISTLKKGNTLEISFEDNGKGISENEIKRIFDPFYTTKAVGSGVGLGLSVSFGIIEKHNGKIEVKSIENKGTTFTIILPVK